MIKLIFSMLIFLISTWANAYSNAAYTVHVDKDRYITAIGSLKIGGQIYDISFDNSFGESLFLGDSNAARLATQQITNVLNGFFTNGIVFGNLEGFYNTYLSLANDQHWLFQVAYSDSMAYESLAGAGWTCCSQHTIQTNVLATFREAIPGSIPDNLPMVPIPSSLVLFLSSLLGLAPVFFKRNRMRLISHHALHVE